MQLKAKIAETAAVDDEIGEANDDSTETADTTPKSSIDRPSRPSKGKAKSSSAADDVDELVRKMTERVESSRQLQERVLAMPKVTERTTFGDFLKIGMQNIHPTLWRSFQRECTSMLWRYQDQSEQLNPTPQPQPPDSRQQSSQLHSPLSQLSQSSQMWQPHPSQWPSDPIPGSVWQSQSTEWMQTESQGQQFNSSHQPPTFTQLQPISRQSSLHVESQQPSTHVSTSTTPSAVSVSLSLMEAVEEQRAKNL